MGRTGFWQLCSLSTAILLLVTGCGGGGNDSGGGNPGGNTPVLQSIKVTPATPAILVGATQQFVATATYSDGHTESVSSSATWFSADPSVATIAAGGVATGVRTGKSSIAATVGTVTGEALISVSALQSIAISPPNPTITAAAQLTATGTYTDGHTADISSSVTWASDRTAVATISASGMATPAGSAGQTTIQATSGAIKSSVTLTVSPPAGWSFWVTHPPGQGGLMDTNYHITAQISGPNEIQSVSASMGGVNLNLTFNPNALCSSSNHNTTPCWLGDINLTGLSRGAHPFVLTATDVLGNVVTWTQTAVYDAKPKIQLTKPTGSVVSQGQVAVKATCTDDDPNGCVSLVAVVCPPTSLCSAPLATGTMSLDTSVDVSTYNGQTSLTFRFLATDSAGQTTSVDLPLFVETSTHYTSVTTVPGDIVDADATRILYYDSANAKLIIHDRNTQAETLILSDPSLTMQYGFLTSTGAAFATTNGSNNYAGKSFESGTLVDLGSGTSLVAKGSYVIWQDGPTLYRRDVSAHSAITIGAGLNSVADLASNGAVVYTAGSHEIRLYKPDGTDVLFATDPTLNTDLPLTDGTSVLYRKVPSSGTNVYNLFLSDGVSDVELVPPYTSVPPSGPSFSRGGSYQIAAGWTAFQKVGPSGVPQVWRRDPSAQETQLSFASTSGLVDKLDGSGSLTFLSADRRYLAAPAQATAVDIGTRLGKTIYIGGVPYVAIAGTLFAVN